jgi:hypothetical protein
MEGFRKIDRAPSRLTVPLNLPVGPANDTKILAPHEAAIFNITSSSSVPLIIVTFELLEIASGTLVGFRA